MQIIGIDEVGRGSWAGPLVAAAVCMAADYRVPVSEDWKLTDSKLLTSAGRLKADTHIRALAQDLAIGWVSALEVDQLGLTAAVRLAMLRALERMPVHDQPIIIDGNYNFVPEYAHVKVVPKADLLNPAVSAASIIAKVARDRYMEELAIKYPAYGFEKHVGYGTSLHRAMIDQHGIIDEHRVTFRGVVAARPNVPTLGLSRG